MTRNKVKLQFIANDSSRKATFKKRTKGILKKTKELSILCGINACAIVYSPYDATPVVWSSDSDVKMLISEFKKYPVDSRQKNMMDQETYLEQRVAKATENLKKLKRENREHELTEVLIQCLEGNMSLYPSNNLNDLNDLGILINQYQKDVNRRIEILRRSGMENGESFNAFAPIENNRTENPIHQQQHPYQQNQFHHPAAPYIGLYDQPHNLNQQLWPMEMMNYPQQMSYAAEQIPLSFRDGSQNYQHQQHILDNSIIVPAADSSNTFIPVPSSNLNNNI